jgi:hypothetical protein
MPQLPDGYPDFLTAESGELIDGQYADRSDQAGPAAGS